MKVIITEFQYNNLLNNNKKTILITESQYERLLLNEQGSADYFIDNVSMGLVDKHYGRPAGSTMRDYKKQQRDQMAANWEDLKSIWNKLQKIHVPTEVEKILGKIDKNIGRPISKWADDVWKYDIPYIMRDIKRAVGENPLDGFDEMFKYLTNPVNWVAVKEGWKLMGQTILNPQSYADVLKGFMELYKFAKKTMSDFGTWLSTWTWEDWADLAAIILYCIPTPLTWGIATAIEAGLVVNAVVKDDLSEAGWRLIGLAGGAILSKAIGGSYKVSQKTLTEVQKITEKGTKIYQTKGQQEFAKYMRNAMKGADSDTEAFLRKLMDYQLKNPNKLNIATKDMEKIQSKYVTLKKTHPDWSDKKLIKHATKEVKGSKIANEIFDHVAPVSSLERKIFATFFTGAKALQFTGYLKQLGVAEKEIDKLLNILAQVNKDKTAEEREKQAEISLYNLKHAVMVKENKAAVKLGLKIENNCSAEKDRFKWKVINPSSSSFTNLNANGELVDGGGNWKYMVVMNDKVPFDESGVYVQEETFSEGTENEWKSANCLTTIKILQKWCKKTNPQRRSNPDFFSSCIEMFSMGNTPAEEASVWLLSDEKINKVSDYKRQEKITNQIIDDLPEFNFDFD